MALGESLQFSGRKARTEIVDCKEFAVYSIKIMQKLAVFL
jgi:hypothetical protein